MRGDRRFARVDHECIEVVKKYLSFFPANCEQRPPVRASDDPDDRMSEKLLDIVPESARHPYDMYALIGEIVDAKPAAVGQRVKHAQRELLGMVERDELRRAREVRS